MLAFLTSFSDLLTMGGIFSRKETTEEKGHDVLDEEFDPSWIAPTIVDHLERVPNETRAAVFQFLSVLDLINLTHVSKLFKQLAQRELSSRQIDITVDQEEVFSEDKKKFAVSTVVEFSCHQQLDDRVRFDLFTHQLFDRSMLNSASFNDDYSFIFSPRCVIDQELFGLRTSNRHQVLDDDNSILRRIASLLTTAVKNCRVHTITIKEGLPESFPYSFELVNDEDLDECMETGKTFDTLDIPCEAAALLKWLRPRAVEFSNEMPEGVTSYALAQLPGLVSAEEIYWWISGGVLTDDLMMSLRAKRVRVGPGALWTPNGVVEYVQEWQRGERTIRSVYCALCTMTFTSLDQFFENLYYLLSYCEELPYSEDIESRLNYYMQGAYTHVRVLRVTADDRDELCIVLKVPKSRAPGSDESLAQADRSLRLHDVTASSIASSVSSFPQQQPILLSLQCAIAVGVNSPSYVK